MTCLARRLALHAYGAGPRESAGALDAFKGLVISAEEIGPLLRGLAGDAGAVEPDAHARQFAESIARSGALIDARRAASDREHTWLPLSRLCRSFGLSRFEELCLIAAAAPDIDLRYEKVYGYLQDDVTRRRPAMGFLLDLFSPGAEQAATARAVFDAHASLLKHRLCVLSDAGVEGATLARTVHADPRIVDFLLGRDAADRALAGMAQVVTPAEHAAVHVDGAVCERVLEYIHARFDASPDAGPLLINLSGPRDCGARALAEDVSRKLGVPLVVADLARLPESVREFTEAIERVARETLLQPAALFLDGLDALMPDAPTNRQRVDALLDAVSTLSRITFAASRHPWRPSRVDDRVSFASLGLDRPDARQGRELWQRYLAREEASVTDADAADLVARFRLGSAGIADAVASARDRARWRSPRDGRVTSADLSDACRELTAPKLATLARKIAPRLGWDDLVLPPEPLDQLRDICRHARHGDVVLGQWGFDRKLPLGRGINALFSGPPGTGKTMAARAIAADLQLDLYQIDLSQVVSKYIGETEKNLARVFDEADASHAILFFDEADALFGKRSEVRDAHDRYANIEVGYLLQRMEEYEGIAILATNMRQNLDEAFVRRLRFIVEFPFPDEAQRRGIWSVTLPREAPLAADVDLEVLAAGIALAGGAIRNVALAAAFAAAADGGVITMAHLLAAAGREHLKMGRTWAGPGTA